MAVNHNGTPSARSLRGTMIMAVNHNGTPSARSRSLSDISALSALPARIAVAQTTI